jgi:uncharacterized protein (DUF2141 family)
MIRFSAVILPFTLFALIVLACATISTPTGGPKDEQPPVLLRSSPDSAQRNFHGRTIELTFSEMLQLNNPKEEIIITPSLGKKTKFTLKDDRVIIEPELNLRENTTYTINFREGIKDATEGNIAEDLRLAFSTGPDLDTLSISGTVRDALTEQIPKTITVAIYEADTFDIFQDNPEYFTRSAKDGTFRITNLKPGNYRIYAFFDKNKNLKIESQTEEFGFLSQPIPLQSSVKKLTIALARVDSRPLRFASVRTIADINTLRFNKPIVSYKINSQVPILSTYGTSQTEVIAYYPQTDQPVDSLLISMTALDSIDQRIDTAVYIKKTDREKIEESFKMTTSDTEFNGETNELQFKVTFNKPIQRFNNDSIYILSDTATVIPIDLRAAKLDTATKQLTYKHKLQVKDSLIAPLLRLGKGTFISIDGDSSHGQSMELTALYLQTTATLLVEIKTQEKNYIVQLVDSQNNIVASSTNDPKPIFKFLKPQTLKLRAIIDKNGNGKWDTVNYLKNQEPEQAVYYMNSEKKYDIPLRANWEVGPNVLSF